MTRATTSLARSAGIIATCAIALMLAACGGGGGPSPVGGGNGGGIIPSTPPPSSTTPAPLTVGGKVVYLAGPLSSSIWNFAEPTGCGPAVSSPCSVYPTPPPVLPNANATPEIGSGVASATVYVVLNAEISGIPPHPIAVATTASDGSFSITLPPNTPSTLGLIAVNGTFDAATGATTTGESLAHASVTIGAPSTLYLDTLSPDELAGFAALNSDRVTLGLNPITSDTIAEAYARATVSTISGTPSCVPTLPSWYSIFGGVGSINGASDDAGPSLPAIVAFNNSFWNNSTATLAGLAGLYQVPSCGPGASFAANYYALAYSF